MTTQQPFANALTIVNTLRTATYTRPGTALTDVGIDITTLATHFPAALRRDNAGDLTQPHLPTLSALLLSALQELATHTAHLQLTVAQQNAKLAQLSATPPMPPSSNAPAPKRPTTAKPKTTKAPSPIPPAEPAAAAPIETDPVKADPTNTEPTTLLPAELVAAKPAKAKPVTAKPANAEPTTPPLAELAEAVPVETKPT